MNKTLLTLLIAFSCLGANAQYFIPHIGLTSNHNTQSISNNGVTYNSKASTGFMAGLGFNTDLGEVVSFQPEVYYIQRRFGIKSKDSVNNSANDPLNNYRKNSYSDQYKIGYLEIPLLFKFQFAQKRFFFTIGPYASIGLGGKDKYNYNYSNTTNGVTVARPISGNEELYFKIYPNGNAVAATITHRTDFGIQPGVGVLIMKKIQLECRWDIGYKNNFPIHPSRNETLIFMASYPINLYPEED